MELPFTGIARGMNEAVRSMARRLFPTGYDVVPEAYAPSTLEEITLRMESGRFAVMGDHSEGTAFGCAETNHAFRAWHDWVHWRYQLPLTYEGEAAAAELQVSQLCQFGLFSPFRADFVRAEVVDHAQVYAIDGAFPADPWMVTATGLLRRGHYYVGVTRLHTLVMRHYGRLPWN